MSTSLRLANRLFAEYLDRKYGLIDVAGITFRTSYALSCLDPLEYEKQLRIWSIKHQYSLNAFNDHEGELHEPTQSRQKYVRHS